MSAQAKLKLPFFDLDTDSVGLGSGKTSCDADAININCPGVLGFVLQLDRDIHGCVPPIAEVPTISPEEVKWVLKTRA